jgi:hypothetical protein
VDAQLSGGRVSGRSAAARLIAAASAPPGKWAVCCRRIPANSGRARRAFLAKIYEITFIPENCLISYQ